MIKNRLILIAIDNNDDIWYEQIIPFILSIRDTDYKGDLGFISYGLSEEKQKLLLENGYLIFQASHTYSELLLDRHISVADIAEKYNYDQVAIYDADIWFPLNTLSVFENIKDSDKLYCSYDLWFCSFLTSCIKLEKRDLINHKLKELTNKNGYVYQAGVIAATREAWIKYREFVFKKLNEKNNIFMLEYGIDAVLLNVYSIEEDRVAYLHNKYNCPPVWGIKQEHNLETGNIEFKLEQELIEGIHVTRAHRETGEISYQNLFSDKYFEEGKKFRLGSNNYWSIVRESITKPYEALYSEQCKKLAFENATTCEHLSIDFYENVAEYSPNTFLIKVSGDSKVCLSNPSSEEIDINFSFRHLFGFRLPKSVFIRKENGEEFSLLSNSAYSVSLLPNEKIEFICQDINISKARGVWVFDNVGVI